MHTAIFEKVKFYLLFHAEMIVFITQEVSSIHFNETISQTWYDIWEEIIQITLSSM